MNKETIALAAIMMLMFITGLFLGYGFGTGGAARTNDVSEWASAAFTAGLSSANLPVEVMLDNRRFYVNAVVAAHRGAWH